MNREEILRVINKEFEKGSRVIVTAGEWDYILEPDCPEDFTLEEDNLIVRVWGLNEEGKKVYEAEADVIPLEQITDVY